MQHFVGSVVGGSTAQEFFKKPIKIAGVIKTDRESYIGYGIGFVVGIHQLFCRFIDPVFHQILKRTHLQGSGKAAAALTLADMDTVSDFVQGQGL